MPRKKSSAQWLKEHFNDRFVKQSKQEGYRSRAAYKLLELQRRDKLFKPGMTVVDLGAAPGSWSQVVKSIIGNKGKIIALDILPMHDLPGVTFLQADFTQESVINDLIELVEKSSIDWVISDIAPNISGIPTVDQARSLELATNALDFAEKVLKPGGGFLVKAFQGEGFEEFLADVRKKFKKVQIRKPEASRERSREVYILAKKV